MGFWAISDYDYYAIFTTYYYYLPAHSEWRAAWTWLLRCAAVALSMFLTYIRKESRFKQASLLRANGRSHVHLNDLSLPAFNWFSNLQWKRAHNLFKSSHFSSHKGTSEKKYSTDFVTNTILHLPVVVVLFCFFVREKKIAVCGLLLLLLLNSYSSCLFLLFFFFFFYSWSWTWTKNTLQEQSKQASKLDIVIIFAPFNTCVSCCWQKQ